MLTPVMIVVSFALVIMSSVKLSLIIAATVPFIILGVVVVAKVSGPVSEKQQTALDGLNRIFKENLTGLRVIRAFNNHQRETERFGQQNRQFAAQSRKLFTLMTSMEPLFFLLMNIAALAIYFTASFMIDQRLLQVGKLIAFRGHGKGHLPVGDGPVFHDAVLYGIHDVSESEYFRKAY